VLKSLLTIGGLQLVVNLILLARTKVLAVFLGPDAVGVLAVVDKFVAVFVQAASLSLPFAAVRFLPALWVSDRGECFRLLRSMTKTIFTAAIVVTVLALAATLIHPALWGVEFSSRSPLLVAALLTVPSAVLLPFLQNAFAGILRHRQSMIFAIAFAGAQALTAFVGAALHSLILLYLSLALLGTIAAAVAFLQLNRIVRPAEPASSSLLPPGYVWRFASALFGLSLLSPYATLYLHYNVLHQFGATEAGWMQAAMGISLAIRTIMGAAHGILLTPHVNRGGSIKERMDWVAEFQRIWCLLAALLIPPLLLAPNVVVGLLYAGSFLPAAKIVFLFVLGDVIYLLVGSYQALVIATDQLRFHVIQNITVQLMMILIAWLTIPHLGMTGAAVAWIIAQVLLFASTSAFLALRNGVRPGARTTAVTAYLLAVLVVVGVLGAPGLEFSVVGLARATTIEIGVIAGLALFLTREDWRRVRQLILSGFTGASPRS
jgi:O-antigen/teichoic acid export membrane protein